MLTQNSARDVITRQNPPDRKATAEGVGRELATLNAIAAATNRIHDLDQLLAEVLDSLLAALDIGDVERASLGGCFLLARDKGLVTQAECRLPPPVCRKLAAICVERNTRLDTSDPAQIGAILSELGQSVENALAGEGYPSAVTIPLAFGNEGFGLLVVALSEPLPFPPHSLELLAAVGHYLSLAIRNIRLHGMEQLRWRALENFQSIAASLGDDLQIDALLQMITDKALETFVAPAASLMLWDEGEQNLVIRASRGLSAEYVRQQRIPRERVLAMLEERGGFAPLLITDLQASALGDGTLIAEEGLRSVLSILLVRADRLIGGLNIYSKDEIRQFSPDEIKLAQTFGNQAAVAIGNAHLYDDARRRVDELTFLNRVGQTITSSLDLSQVLRVSLSEAIKVVGVEAASIFLLDENTGEMVFEIGVGVGSGKLSGLRLPPEVGVAGWVAQTGQSAIIPHAAQDERFFPDVDLITGFTTHSILCVPLKIKDQVIGAIEMINKVAGSFNQHDLELLSSLSTSAAIAIENARLYGETQRQFNELSLLHEVAVVSASTLDSTEILRKAAEVLSEKFDFSVFGFMLLDQEAGVLRVCPPVLGLPPDLSDLTMPVGQGILGWVAQHGEPLLVPDVEKDPRYVAAFPGIRSEMCVPLKVGGKVIGVLDVESTRLNAFSADDLRVLSTLAGQLAVSIENARLFQETLEHIAEVEKLKEFNERIIENARDIIYVHDLDGNFTFTNQRATDITGYSREEILKLNIADVVAPEFLEMARSKMRIQRGKTVLPYELEIVSKDGERIPVELSASPLEEQGWVVGSVGIARDQREMRRIQAKLREKRDQLRAVFDGITDLLSVHAEDTTVIMVNRAWANRAGLPFSDIVGRKCHEIFGCYGDPCDLCPVRKTFASGEPFFREVQWPHTHDTVHTWSYPVRDNEGRVTSVLAYTKIVTQQKELERQLLQAEKLSAIGQLVAGVAHELNNPLTAIMGYAQLLQAADLDEGARKDLERIRCEAERSARIVRNLLTFASRHEGLKKQRLDVNEVLDHTLELRAYQFKVDNIEVVKELDEKLPPTMANSDQLQQVFLNIINNAHQAMVEARGRGKLIVRTSRRPASEDGEAFIRIEMIDDGPGVSPENIGRVFDPFFTTKEVGQGVGLGLSIAYGIIEEHKGRIWVESPATEHRIGGGGPGTRFVIELPVKAEAAVSSVEPLAEDGFPLPGQKLILVVEDEPEVANLVSRVLVREGHHVHTATDGRTALRRLKQTHYDLIISDLKMPGMGGEELYQCVQEFDPALVERMMFFTGDTVNRQSLAFLRETGSVYLTKPFHVDELMNAVREALQSAEG